MDIFSVADFRYNAQTVKLPIADKTNLEDNMLVMLIRDTSNTIDIFKNSRFTAQDKYGRYYKPKQYVDKIMHKQVKWKMNSSDMKDTKTFASSLGLVYYDNPKAIAKKNVVLDTSTFHSEFFSKCEGKDLKLVSTEYVVHLRNFIEECNFPHEHKYIVINTNDWGIDQSNKANTFSSTNRHLNPINIIYYLMKKDHEILKENLKSYRVLILDSDNGWFVFEVDRITATDYNKFHDVFQRFKTDTVKVDDDEAESSERKAIAQDSDEEDKSHTNIEDEGGNIETPKTTSSEEEEEGIPEDEKLLRAAAEINANFDSVSRSAASNKRNQELREAQKKIKLDNLRVGDLDSREKVDYTIDEIDLSAKIFSPSDTVKRVRFDNFNDSYNRKMRRRDLVNVFRALNNKSIPVYIRDIKVEDSSTPMDLKETWHITLEGEDRVRHSITIDVPKVYDKNYLVLGGNRKQFNNQLCFNPVVKIAPDTVEICTDYNKVFMYRYGEIMSPKVTIFKKIIANNPKYFKIKRGNGVALSKGHKTSIEYDSIAKDFLDIEIRGTGFHLRCDQKFFDQEVTEGRLSKIGDDYLYCFFDETKKDALRAIPVNIEKDNDGRDLRTDEEFSVDQAKNYDDEGKNGIIDIFTWCFKDKTKVDFWSLAGPNDKAGKRFMFTRCTIMAKKIPTIILLSYFEGLTRVLNKAGVRYQFSDKRPRVGLDQAVIQFSDGFLVYDRNPTAISLLMNGLSVVDTKGYTFAEFDQKGVYLDIFDALYGSRILASGLDSYYDNMIDMKTKEVLELYNYPTDVVSLFIFASNLLADNNYVSEISLEAYRVRSMEMVATYLHKIISNAYSEYRRTAMNKTPHKISVPKNALIKEISTSNILEDYSIINPITEKEKLHNITCKGPTGVNLERAYTEARRCYHESMVGCIGISTSPDMNVGVQRELTIEPKLINSMGYIDLEKKNKDMRDTNIFTYAEMLSPGGIMKDDAIRSAMARLVAHVPVMVHCKDI